MNEFEKMRTGYLYNCTERSVSKKHNRALRFCERYNKVSVTKWNKRSRIIRKLINCDDKNIYITSPFMLEYGENVTIGKNFFSNFNFTMLDVAKIDIGDNVMIGVNVALVTPMHPLIADERVVQKYPTGRFDLEYAKPIKIGNNVWISSSVTVCGGVTIGDNAVIGAGSVVVKDVPPNTLVAGVPARVIRELDEKDRIDVWNPYVSEKIPISERNKNK